MLRRSNSRELFFLRTETNYKDNAIKSYVFFMIMEIAAKFEAVKLG